MAINFPNPATLNQTYTVGTKTWVYNGYAWDLVLANTSPILNVATSAFGQANAAYTQANTGISVGQGAFGQANAAFDQANTGVAIGQGAFGQANSAYDQANTGISVGKAAFGQANAAYEQANTGVAIGQGAFGQANSGFEQANSAYTQANTALIIGQNAFSQANAAYTQANTGISIGQGAFAQANSEPIGKNAFSQANSAYTQANTGVTIGQGAFDQANSSFAQANTALTVGQGAFSQANTGISIGQGAFDQANSAYTQANTGISIGQGAFSQANVGVAIGQGAFDQANSAYTQANAAYGQANTGIMLTQTAFGQANLAYTQANVGVAIGQESFGQANSAYTQANTGVTIGQGAFDQANAAYNTANTKFSANGGTINGSVTITNDLNVTGNVYLSGNVTTLSSNNISINDPVIYLAQDNPANLQDIGFVGHFTTSSYQHTGLVRDASDGIWKLFSNVATEPAVTIDFTGAVYDTFQVGTLVSSNASFTVASGTAPFTVNSVTLVNNLNADMLDGQQANYYTGLSNSANTQANLGIAIGQGAFVQANSGFNQANAAVTTGQNAFSQANAAYNQANTGITIGQGAFGQANVALTTGQTAFTQANTALTTGQTAFTQANSAFTQANVGILLAQTAFTQANTGITIGQGAFDQANSAYSQANVGIVLAQTAFTQANVGYSQANVGIVIGQSAFAQANAAYNKANTGGTGGGLTPTAIKTANGYIAIANDLVRCNTVAGAFSVSLPASPADGAIIGITDIGNTFGINNLTLLPNGNLLESYSTPYILDINGAYVSFVYNTATTNWKLLETPVTIISAVANVSISQGGTGVTTLAANSVLLGNGTSAVQTVSPGTTGNVLTSNNGTWISAPAPISLPTQTSNGGKYLTTDGATASWVSLPLGSVYDLANVGISVAQSAFSQANTGVTIGQGAFSQANAAYNTANTKFSANGGTITGSVTIATDLSVTGNVYLGGNVTTLSSNNLSINDPLIYMAQDNPANLYDIGFVGHFTTSSYQHTGLVRDATDGIWKLFSNVASEPTTTMDFAGAIYDTLKVGSISASNASFTIATGTAPFTVTSNTLISNLNADLLDGQHGSYYANLANTVLPSQSANTGKYLTTDGTTASWSGIPRNVPILNRSGNTVNVSFTFNYIPVLNHANTSTIQVGII
jgi:carbonic anhydrase/acetyltransferase-like protein (isoleucine patch superfamily)